MKSKLKLFIILTAVFYFISCNDFLDTLPDTRSEVNTPEKIAQLLLSAYPTEMPTMFFEVMSDNITDNGPTYSSDLTVTQAYHYENITDPSWDGPTRTWQVTYQNISAANYALQIIEELNDPQATQAAKAEALLCRAFGHFVLVNTFCKAYHPFYSENESLSPGIPYIEKPETIINMRHERKSVAFVYEKINQDIEDGLSLLIDKFEKPAFHFNHNAAYAFAARFNLYYGKWEKVIEYATEALGSDPIKLFRDAAVYLNYTQSVDKYNAYASTEEPCNFLMLPQRSRWGSLYTSTSTRYGQSRGKTYNCLWQWFPWGGAANGYGSAYGSDQNIYYPKYRQTFVYSNPIAGTGTPYTVKIEFTAEETIACRAEANAMLKKYDDATRDLNLWYWRNSAGHNTFDKYQIAEWYSKERSLTSGVNKFITVPRPSMSSEFHIEPGMQENLVRAALAIRRLEGVHVGLRWLDIKRHGIIVKHPVQTSATEADTIILNPYSNITAVQLPVDVIASGMRANPR